MSTHIGYSFLAVTLISLLAVFFGVWELVENRYFLDVSPVTMHYLYITRGITSSLVLATCSVWYVLKSRNAYEYKLKKSEEQYRNIVENTSDAILAFDAQLSLRNWNTGALNLYDYRMEEVQDDWMRIIPPDLRSRYLALIDKVRQGHAVCNLDTTRLDRSGRRLQVVINLAAVRDAGGEVSGFVEIARDFTEKNMLQNKLLHTEKLATIGQIAAGLAHEMNTPLGCILISAQMLKDSACMDHENLRDLEKIERQVRRCKEIVQHLLNFAHPGPGQMHRQDLCRLITQCVRLLEHRLASANVQVSMETKAADCTLECDETQMEQLFVNLFMNSLDAQPSGGRIAVTISQMDSGLEVQIIDEGTGIKNENLSRVFEPFFTTKRLGQGTGLGLSICRRIVENHGGRITVQSQSGTGSTFVLRFPAGGG